MRMSTQQFLIAMIAGAGVLLVILILIVTRLP